MFIDPKTFPTTLGSDEKTPPCFFERLCKTYPFPSNIAFIVVNHVVSNLLPFVQALSRVGRIIAIIPKSSFPSDEISEKLKIDGYTLSKEITKEILRKNPNEAVSLIKNKISKNERVVIIDMGGYFSSCLQTLEKDEFVKERLLGIVEDTENGHQKYEKALRKTVTSFPLLSIARSPLKAIEDKYVGKAIVNAARTIHKEETTAGVLEEQHQIGVIGLGKIGWSIAKNLRALSKFNVQLIVFDKKETIRSKAISQGYEVTSTLDELLQKSTFIFSATGQGAINEKNVHLLRSGVFIASCTSSDDEFRLPMLMQPPNKEKGNFSVYKVSEGKEVTFLCRGNAVNFSQGGTNGPYIYGVLAELIVAAQRIANKEIRVRQELQTLSKNENKQIAEIWNRYFNDVSDEEVKRTYISLGCSAEQNAFAAEGPHQSSNTRMSKTSK